MTNTTKKFDQLRNRCESTPFLQVHLGDKARVDMYWTKNAGSMGYQVHTVIYDWNADDDNDRIIFSKSGGYGYAKDDHELGYALCHLSLYPKGMRVGGESIPNQYHIGGNLYKVPNSKLLKRRPKR
jgi:hypothetical protein